MRHLGLLLVALLFTACASDGEGATVPSVSDSASVSDPEVATAIADLVARAGVTADEITVVSVDEVTWRNSSIGCPEPGGRYLQALVDGRRIVLEAAGRHYEYHSGGRRPVFYCATPERPVGE